MQLGALRNYALKRGRFGRCGNRTPDRVALNWLIATALVGLLPHVWDLPFWATLCVLAATAWRFGCDHWHWYRPGRLLRIALTIGAIAAVWLHFGTLFGRDAGVTLLVILIGLKFLELRALRDFILVVFLIFVATLGSFLYDQTLRVGAYALVITVIGMATLIRLNQPMGFGVRAYLRLSARLLAQALPLTLVIYLLFPRIQGALWALPVDAHGAHTGIPEVMRPGSINELSTSNDVALRATFAGALPPARQLYWRTRVLWDTDGRAWSRGEEFRHNDGYTPIGPPVRYVLTLEPSQHPWLPALDLPATIPDGARAGDGFVFELPQPLNERASFDIVSYPQYRTGALSNAERVRALGLPKGLSPRVRRLAQQWTAQMNEPRDIVQAALNFFREEHFFYTLTPPALGTDPVDEFLFSTRRGFCEHYAAAFTTLMRVAGIPSRVVIGYHGGEVNATGNYLIVRQSDAHAWTEVWLPGAGWARVDPTAAVAPERIEYGMEAVRRLQAQGAVLGSLTSEAVLRAMRLNWLEHAWRRTHWSWDYLNISWYRWITDYGKERQRNLLEKLGINRTVSFALIALIIALAFVYAVPFWRGRRIAPVQASYLHFCQKLARAGLIRTPQEGPTTFALRCSSQRPDLKDAIAAITRCYIELRYGAAGGPEHLRALKRQVITFRATRR